MFKDSPLHVGCEGVVCLVSQGGAVLTQLVVALGDVYVNVIIVLTKNSANVVQATLGMSMSQSPFKRIR